MSSYGQLIRDVQGGKIAPVYQLAGSDAFLQDHFVREIAKKFLPEGERKHVYTLADDKADDILADLKAYSLFGGREMIVMLQAQRIAGAAKDTLLEYVAAPNPDKCLVLVMEEYQPTKGLQKKLSKHVPVVDTRPPFPDKLKAWAVYHAKQEGHTIDPNALEQLLSAVGDSAGHITSELNKIFSRLEPGDPVTAAMVDEMVQQDLAFHMWHLQEAMALRNTKQALGILMNLLNYGAAGPQIIQALTSLYVQLLYLQSGTVEQSVYTGLNKPVSSRLPKMGSLYRASETATILKNLLSADVQLKSTPAATASVLVPLVISIAGSK